MTAFGKNIVGSAVLDDRTFSGDATVDFTDYFNGLYKKYIFYICDYFPATDFTNLYIRTSQDGSTFDTGASDYSYVNRGFDDSNTASTSNSATAAFMRINTNSIGGTSGGLGDEGYSGFVVLYDPLDSSRYTNFYHEASYRNSFNQSLSVYGTGQRLEADVVRGVRFFASSDNCSGRIVMVGVE